AAFGDSETLNVCPSSSAANVQLAAVDVEERRLQISAFQDIVSEGGVAGIWVVTAAHDHIGVDVSSSFVEKDAMAVIPRPHAQADLARGNGAGVESSVDGPGAKRQP